MDRAIKFFPAILLIFHAVGIGIFLVLATAPELSYVNLLLSALLVLAAEKKSISTYLVFAIIILSGFMIELIGVQTGILFGNYEYGSSMGPSILGTPIIIGTTWYAVVVCSAAVIHRYDFPLLVKGVAIGLLTVLMDILIEQVAVKYGMWSWEDGVIPFYNFVCWFIFGTLFGILYSQNSKAYNPTANYLFWIWVAFFFILIIV